ncbi:MAG: DNA-binding protein WhiA [Angelakisella sp.]
MSTVNSSYTAQLKHEILQSKQWRSSYKKPLACGLLYFSQHFSVEEVSITTMDEQAARFYAGLVPRLVPLAGSITTTETATAGNITYTVQVDAFEDRLNLLNYFAMLYPEGVTFDLLGGEHGTAAFLAGAFVACGSLADPEKKYHLEYAVPRPEAEKVITDMLSEVGFQARVAERRGLPLIYFHDSKQIEDILTFLGCPKLTLELMGVKILKERRNAANRASNCDSANIDKTIGAAYAQITAINRIYTLRGEDFLPDDLRELAALRVAQPELSLRELGQQLAVPLSRSGVNHRLQRLIEMAKELEG